MKKILFLAILIGCSYLGKAQDIEEVDVLDISANEAISFALAPLSTNEITTGFWKDKALDLGEMERYRGLSTDTTADFIRWQLLYLSMMMVELNIKNTFVMNLIFSNLGTVNTGY